MGLLNAKLANSGPITFLSAWSIPRQLISKSKEEGKICEAAYLRAEAAGGKFQGVDDDEGHYYFVDSAKTLRVADEMKRYPGAPKSAFEAARKITEQIENNKALQDLSFIYELPDFHSVGYFKLGKALVESARRYKFDTTSMAAVREAVLTYVTTDLNEPLPLIDVMIRIALLERLQDVKLIASKEILPLRKRAEELKNDIHSRNAKWEAVTGIEGYRKLPEADRRALSKIWVDEFRQSGKLCRDLSKLLAKLKFRALGQSPRSQQSRKKFSVWDQRETLCEEGGKHDQN